MPRLAVCVCLFASLAVGLRPSPAASPAPAAGAAPAVRSRPNIVLILVDDMGYSDLGCYGGEIPTPNLDALAAGGTRWRQFYNCAQCCPTRASLMTGLYPHQAGVGDMIDRHSLDTRRAAASPAYGDHLSPRAVTIAEALKPAGYATYMVGKWHLGYADGQRPRQRGFDRYFGIIAGADSYWKPASLRLDDAPVREVPAGFYATDAFTDKAVEFVESGDPAQPFFLYLAYNAPHAPFQARPEDIARHTDRYRVGWDKIRRRRFDRQKELGFWPADMALPPRDPQSRPWEGAPDQQKLADRMAIYAAMVESVDRNVGRLMAALKRRGVADDTLVMFLSDNGAWASGATYGIEWAETGDTPLRLFKVCTHEGGICTPFIACWPRRIPAGVLDKQRYGHVKDVWATCLEAAGAAPPQTRDGRPAITPESRSLLPALTNPAGAGDETLFWERRGNSAVRDGRWKLVRSYNAHRLKGLAEGARTGRWELYDLAEDPNETRDLADRHPGRVREMAARYEAWEKRVGVVPREVINERIAEAADRPE
jgi:arylsulfatase